MEEYIDDAGKPLYKESKLTEVEFKKDGPMSSYPIYTFEDDHKTRDAIYNRSGSGGGEIQKKKTTKVEKKKKIFQKEILNIINI
jgi:hypothetical protein